MAHFTLYALKGMWGTNPIKVGAFLEALGLEYDMKFVELGSSDKATGVKGEDYLNVCENGRTPTLIDHKRNDFTVWESGAILDYVATVYDTEHKFHGKTPEERALVMQWLFFQVSGHSPVQGNLFFSKMFWPSTFNENAPENVIKRFRTELDRVFRVYERRLKHQASMYGEDRAFLALDRPTIADFSALGWIVMLPDYASKIDIDLAEYETLAKYIDRLRNLPSSKAVMARFESSK